MQVEIEVFEIFFQKQRFNNEIYTRLTCLKDIFCYQLANHYAQFDNKTRSLTTVLQGLPTSCQLELANCNLPLPLNLQSCLSRVPEIPALYNEPTISQLEVLFMKINYKNLGKRIQSARRETGLSQEQLAEAIGKSPSAVSTIETGKRGASLETLIRIEMRYRYPPTICWPISCPTSPGSLPGNRSSFFETARSGSCRCFKR